MAHPDPNGDIRAQPRLSDGRYTYARRSEFGFDLSLGPVEAASPRDFDRLLGSVKRHRALVTGGYVPAEAFAAATDPRSAAAREAYWTQVLASAEHAPHSRAYPKMGVGDLDSGLGRSSRRAYDVDGWTLRFGGSVAEAKRFAVEHGPTFDLPLAVADPDGHAAVCWVRVTNSRPGNWHAEPLGFSGPAADQIAAAVQSVLEASRPTMIPRRAGGLAARARERARAIGHAVDHPLASTWLDAVAYNDDEGTMITRTSAGHLYGHTVAREVFEQITLSPSPGRAFNELIRDNPDARPVQVTECAACSRVHPADVTHSCPATNAAPRPGAPGSQAATIAAVRIAQQAVEVRAAFIARLRS